MLTYADEFWILSTLFFAVLILLPLMRRVRGEPGPSGERVEGLPTAAEVAARHRLLDQHRTARMATQARFITPATNNSAMRAQQQPRQ